jgi:hypothetical protein
MAAISLALALALALAQVLVESTAKAYESEPWVAWCRLVVLGAFDDPSVSMRVERPEMGSSADASLTMVRRQPVFQLE